MTAEWYYQNASGREVGPITASQLKQMANKGTVEGETLIKKGEGSWVKARKARGLFDSHAPDGAEGVPVQSDGSQTIKPPSVTNLPPPIPENYSTNPEKEESPEKPSILGIMAVWIKNLGMLLVTALVGCALLIFVVGYAFLTGPSLATKSFNQGVENSKLQQYDKAIADYTRAIGLDPKYAMAYYNRGLAYRKLVQFDKAITDWTKAIELDPKLAGAYNRRGDAYGRTQQYVKAIVDCNKAIELDPKVADYYLSRGFAYGDSKQYDKAITDWTKAIELDPEGADAYSTYDAYSSRGWAYNKLNQFELAIADYTKAIELDPKDALTYKDRGRAYLKVGKEEEAEADFAKAKMLNKGN